MVLELHFCQFANMVHIFDVGTRAWQPDPTEGWVGSELVEKLVDGDKVTLVFSLENGEVSKHHHHHPQFQGSSVQHVELEYGNITDNKLPQNTDQDNPDDGS